MLNEKLFCPEKGLNQNLRHFLNKNYFIDGNSIKAKPFKESEYFLKDNPIGFGYYYETADIKDYGFYATYYHSIKSMDLKYYGELLHYNKTVAIKHSVSAVFDLGDYHYLDCESVTILDFLHFYPNLQKKGFNVKSQNCEMYHVPFHIASKNTRLEWYYRIVSCKNNEHLRNLGNKEDTTFEAFKGSAHHFEDFIEHGTIYACQCFMLNTVLISERLAMPGSFMPQKTDVSVDIPMRLTDENIALVKSFGGILAFDDNDYISEGYGIPKFYCHNFGVSAKEMIEIWFKVKPERTPKNPLELAYNFVIANFNDIKASFAKENYYDETAKA